jgi:hypothetical protein
LYLTDLRCLADLPAYDCDEEVGNAGCAYVAQCAELLAIGTIEEQDAAAEDLALVNWL